MSVSHSENLHRIQSTVYSSLLVIGDTHIANHRQCGGVSVDGLNQRCRWILNSLKAMVADAHKHHSTDATPKRVLVLQLGDFFDVAKPPPAIILAALNLIKETSAQADWLVLSGNHDSNGPEQASAVRLLEYAGAHTVERPQLVSVNTTTSGVVHIACIPYTHPSAMQAFVDAQDIIAKSDVVLAHYGIVHDTAQVRPDVLKISEVIELDRKFSAHQTTEPRTTTNRRQYYSGHEHNSSAHYRSKDTPGVLIHNVGAFVDTNFDVNNPIGRPYCDAASGGVFYFRSAVASKPVLFAPKDYRLDTIIHHYAAFNDGFCVRFPMGAEPLAEMLKSAGLLSAYTISPTNLPSGSNTDEEEATSTDKPEQALLSPNGLLAEAAIELEKLHGRSYQNGLAFAMGLSK